MTVSYQRAKTHADSRSSQAGGFSFCEELTGVR